VPLPDGRELAYAEYGPATGMPVVFLPGAGCGRLMSFGEELLEVRQVRLVSVDRPGLGMSTLHSEKTFASVAADVASLIDTLAGEPVPLVANSQAAPFGLAVAAVGAASGVVLASPIDDLAHPPIRALLPDEHRALIDGVEADPGRALTTLSNITPDVLMDMVMRDHPLSDTPVFGDPAFRAGYALALSDGFGCGSEGYARDTVLAMTAWPEDLFPPGVPVVLLMGADDHAHSPDRGATLAARLDADRTVVDDVGGSLLWARADLVLDAAKRT
jgi:pimeloyl-ACP methyl ester carboxylesterase